MKITIPIVAGVLAALILAPTANADPLTQNDEQFLQEVTAVGINGNPHGLISGAWNVCRDLDGGVSESDWESKLQKFSGYTEFQSRAYIAKAVGHYCPNDADKLP
jgi:hypothetical protein